MSLLIALTTLVEDRDLSRMSQRQGMTNITETRTWFQIFSGSTEKHQLWKCYILSDPDTVGRQAFTDWGGIINLYPLALKHNSWLSKAIFTFLVCLQNMFSCTTQLWFSFLLKPGYNVFSYYIPLFLLCKCTIILRVTRGCPQPMAQSSVLPRNLPTGVKESSQPCHLAKPPAWQQLSATHHLSAKHRVLSQPWGGW